MSRCKSCGNALVIKSGVNKCVICGAQAGLFRSLTAASAFTNRGVAKQLARKTGMSVRRSGSEMDVAPWTWKEAELVACAWMRSHGYRDAQLTRSGADGGVDVTSRKGVAQVKFQSKRVGLAEMQRLQGIAAATGKRALFFASSGYSAQALAWARRHQIETYVYPPVRLVK